jgi:hypothetical protein
MLRGPQTPGELRSRSDRLFSFDDLAAVQSTLERLATRTPNDPGSETSSGISNGISREATVPLTIILPRQPGSREARYAHLLGGVPDLSIAQPTFPDRAEPAASTTQRLAQLEARLETEIAALSTALQALHTRLDRLESEAETHPPTAISSVR